jgi:1,4-alpha-glucan branching enzyme
VVLLDVVHSHISSNADDGLAGFDLGQSQDCSYFRGGEAGYHKQWDSRILNYGHWEVQRYLLSNLRYWLDEFQFDGFRFDGVTSMLYHHHGIDTGFSGSYNEYFGPQADVEAAVYLMMANEMVHNLLPDAITIAEDVSGMPGLGRPVPEGGLGFDYRLNMAIPDTWIKLLKHVRDENWDMMELVNALCNRRYTEKTVAYAESHDQALVGDKTIAMWLFDAEMYTNMSTLNEITPVVDRGMCMHKMIRMVTMCLGGESWLNFMGNEFGHPEWLDFPRDGNEWSHKHCRRQWSLVDTDHMRYCQLNEFDKAMQELDDKYGFLSSDLQWVTHIDNERKVLVAERGPLVFVFNWHPHDDYEGLKVAAPTPGKYSVVMDSDAWHFGGKGRVAWDGEHFTAPATEEEGGKFHDRDQYFQVMAPSRTVVAYAIAPEDNQQQRQPWEQASNGGGGRFSKYIRDNGAETSSSSSWRNGGSNGAGSNVASEGGGRFASYIQQRESQSGRGTSGTYERQQQPWEQNGSSGQSEGRFAKYLGKGSN